MGLPRWLSGKEPAKQEILIQSLGREDALEREKATHSNIRAWEILWTEEPGGLQSMGSQKSQTLLSMQEDCGKTIGGCLSWGLCYYYLLYVLSPS